MNRVPPAIDVDEMASVLGVRRRVLRETVWLILPRSVRLHPGPVGRLSGPGVLALALLVRIWPRVVTTDFARRIADAVLQDPTAETIQFDIGDDPAVVTVDLRVAREALTRPKRPR